MVISPTGPIYRALIERYGQRNICWPIIAYNLEGPSVRFLMIEVNALNRTNEHVLGPFLGPAPYPEYRLDYLADPRPPLPIPLGHDHAWPGPKDIIANLYASSYEFVTTKGGLNTIDIDYVWRTNCGLRGLELTTFYNEMSSRTYAEHLVQRFIEERAGRRGAHQFALQAEVAEKKSIELHLAFVNTEGHSLNVKTDGKVYVILLDRDAARTLHSGQLVCGEYLDFSEWLLEL